MMTVDEIRAACAAGEPVGMMCVDALDAIAVGSYEWGAVTKGLCYAHHTKDSDHRQGYIAHARTDAADLLMQLRLAFIHLTGRDIDLVALAEMGEMRWLDTMEDYRTGRREM